MPKRKNSDSEEYGYLERKLRKLQRKLNKVRRKKRRDSRSSKSSQYDDSLPEISDIQEIPVESERSYDDEVEPKSIRSAVQVYEVTPDVEMSFDVPPQPGPAVEPTPAPAPSPEPIPGPANAQVPNLELAPTVQLDSDILEILGDDPTVPKVTGKEILPALAVRLQHIATSGLTTEARKELHNKYALPSNCLLIGAPSLNPEVKAAITESVLKRDQSIEGKQKQLAVAISCVTDAIMPLMCNDKKDSVQLQLLMDAIRMLCDIQYKHTSIRRGLLMNNLKKDLKDQIQGTKVDSFLFGHNFADNLKSAKAISKSGAELKPNVLKPVQMKKPGPSGPPKKTFPTSQHLNWKAPPPSRRPTGTQRMKEPVSHRSQPARSSRKSSQQGPARNWRQ